MVPAVHKGTPSPGWGPRLRPLSPTLRLLDRSRYVAWDVAWDVAEWRNCGRPAGLRNGRNRIRSFGWGRMGSRSVRTDKLGPADGGQASGQPALSFRWAPVAGRDRDTQGGRLPRAQPCHAWHCHAWLCIALHSIAMLCNRLGRMAPLGEDPIRPVGVGVRWHFPERALRPKTPRGARTHAVLASLLQTLRQPGRETLTYRISVRTAPARLPPLFPPPLWDTS
jgi:hypothetical protein